MIKSDNTPSKPFLLLNEYFICAFGLNRWADAGTSEAFEDSKKISNLLIIDVNCQMFSVKRIINKGVRKNIFNIFGIIRFNNFFSGRVMYNLDFSVGEPEQWDFEKSREFLSDLIIRQRWAGQTGATPAQYRKSLEEIHDMRSLIEHIGFLGRWPF